ncbi:MAG TPA: YqeG family HAD IIIA-type phosphatase [Oscillospiraceae bacterium]|nr:YqeG family HAD IIIA-type phosphatase [Oscillospiraceae bacterium]HPF55487.1 YqeG family HAD IIIA-type phosphatase [Clostridiales bacterium]HPK34791.1 YqeG family HAD IIIA-type phosphatase [Oscillospiraceae bacterium]HPR75841.1 YqeG family HAD IIIA-type phosphatase [Oscillospiraceae bacterium]
MKIFTPDEMFSDLCEITTQMLKTRGITWLALDLDNTITHDCHDEIPEKIAERLNDLKAAGISLAVISNNNSARVKRFADKSGLICIPQSQKPKKKGLLAASKALGKPLSEGAVVGDQIFTDVWAGKNAGMAVFLVEPLGEDLGWFVRFKRRLERLTKAGRNRATCK